MPTETELELLKARRLGTIIAAKMFRLMNKAGKRAEIDALNEEYIAALEADNSELRQQLAAAEGALKGVDELAAEGVGEFSLSSAKRDFLDIRDVVSEVLHKHPATPPAADADTSDGERTE